MALQNCQSPSCMSRVKRFCTNTECFNSTHKNSATFPTYCQSKCRYRKTDRQGRQEWQSSFSVQSTSIGNHTIIDMNDNVLYHNNLGMCR